MIINISTSENRVSINGWLYFDCASKETAGALKDYLDGMVESNEIIDIWGLE